MGTKQVGLGGHQFGRLLLGLDVLARPDAALGNRHVEEVFPGLGFEVLDLARGQGFTHLGQGRDGVHPDRAATFLHLLEHQVVTQTGGGNGSLAIRRVVVQHLLVLGQPICSHCYPKQP